MPSRILIVDDDAMVLEALAGMTRYESTRVTRACVLGESRFQLLIRDQSALAPTWGIKRILLKGSSGGGRYANVIR